MNGKAAGRRAVTVETMRYINEKKVTGQHIQNTVKMVARLMALLSRDI